MNTRIHIDSLARLGVNAALKVAFDQENQLTECRLEMLDSPRNFANALPGKSWELVHQIVSRASAFCSLSHQLASIRATAAAFGVEVSPQTALLRQLALNGEILQSHMRYLGFFIVPDLLGSGGLLALGQTDKSHSLPFVALHRLGNEIVRVVGGRAVHPQRLVPGGFTRHPAFLELRSIRQRIRAKMPQVMEIGRFLARHKDRLPEFQRVAPFAALQAKGEFVESSDGRTWRPDEWIGVQPGFRLGALARFSLNPGRLTTRAAKVAEIMGLASPLHNPFHEPLARYAEAVMALEETVAMIDGIEESGILDEAPVPVQPQAGVAAAALEAPGGTLAHLYEYDGRGRIVQARISRGSDCLREDMEAFARQCVGEDGDSLARKMSLLVRAHDPCGCP